ncbi:MAG: hypothetical protein HQM06_11555 [Magnetococcales bacterium]|nr:hypothetical protein [Magnetococcales bacterium]
MVADWHWFKYHFTTDPIHRFAYHLIETVVDCDIVINNNFGEIFLDRLLAIQNREKNRDHYNQLIQLLAELIIIKQSIAIRCEEPIYIIEPVVDRSIVKSKKSPDLLILSKTINISIEIKAPSYLEIQALRESPYQLISRLPFTPQERADLFGSNVTLPRDNAVKDFLISADEKFANIKKKYDCLSLLVIVWDDYVQEVISCLTHEMSGLLTQNSFAKDRDGTPLLYNNIDAIIVVRQLHYIACCAGDKMLDRKNGFDFGDINSVPNIFIGNNIKEINSIIIEPFRVISLSDEFASNFAEHTPMDLIIWLP